MEEQIEQKEQQEQVVLSKGLDELKKDLKNKNLIFGKDRAIKQLRLGKLAKIYLASNIPAELKADMDYYSKMNDMHVVHLEIPNDELGTFCKKQFSVSVIGLTK